MSNKQNNKGQTSNKGGCKKAQKPQSERKGFTPKAGKKSQGGGKFAKTNHVTDIEFMVRKGMGKTVAVVVNEPNHMSAKEFMAEQQRLTEIARKVNASWLIS